MFQTVLVRAHHLSQAIRHIGVDDAPRVMGFLIVLFICASALEALLCFITRHPVRCSIVANSNRAVSWRGCSTDLRPSWDEDTREEGDVETESTGVPNPSQTKHGPRVRQASEEPQPNPLPPSISPIFMQPTLEVKGDWYRRRRLVDSTYSTQRRILLCEQSEIS